MADESEMNMEALKKAYAEIVLNTSKEAATRVMAAEGKALSFHHDLVTLKEESLRMFLRLKENFNSKITEADVRSFSQQMKIEELEAQLSEAEGIIVDLRHELKQVQEKLDIMSHNQKQPLNEPVLQVDETAYECAQQNNKLDSSPYVISPVSDGESLSIENEREAANLHPRPHIRKCCHALMNSNGLSSKSHLDRYDSGNYDITSIMKNRETEPYRNGCTQRIRAFGRNLSNVNLASSSEDNQPTVNVQSELKQEETSNGSKFSMIDSEHLPSKSTLFTDKMANGCENLLADATLQDREKKRPRSSDDSSRISPNVNVNAIFGKDPLADCSSKTAKKDLKTNISLSEGQLQNDFNSDKDQTIRSLRRSARKNSRYKEAIAALKRSSRKNCIKSHEPTHSPRHKTTSGGIKSHNPMEITEKGSKYTEFYCRSLSDELCTSIEIKVDCNDVVCGQAELGCSKEGSAVKKREVFSEQLCPEFVDSMVVDAELFDVPISEELDNIETHSQGHQAGSDRPLKFTFQRRRRKNVLSKLDQNISLQEHHG